MTYRTQGRWVYRTVTNLKRPDQPWSGRFTLQTAPEPELAMTYGHPDHPVLTLDANQCASAA